MRNDAIIFDIDGTLWNACLTTASGWSAGLLKIGINKKVSPEDIEKVAGNTIDASVDALLPGLRMRYPKLLGILVEGELAAFQAQGGIFYEGVVEGIKELSKSHKIFLVSNCPEWYMQFFLKFFGIEKAITGLDCHGISGLPKNEMLTRVKENYSLKNPVYIGDTASDEEASRLAGIEFIHVIYGFGNPKSKVKSFDSFPSIVDYFMESVAFPQEIQGIPA
jgi:phosphoglycolate phosphatase